MEKGVLKWMNLSRNPSEVRKVKVRGFSLAYRWTGTRSLKRKEEWEDPRAEA